MIQKNSHEVTQEGTTQVSIQEFFVKKAKDTITSERVVEPCGFKDTESAMTVQDQIMKAEHCGLLRLPVKTFHSEYQMEYQSYFKRCSQTQL